MYSAAVLVLDLVSAPRAGLTLAYIAPAPAYGGWARALQQGPDRWPSTGNPFLWVTEILQRDLDHRYQGRSG